MNQYRLSWLEIYILYCKSLRIMIFDKFLAYINLIKRYDFLKLFQIVIYVGI